MSRRIGRWIVLLRGIVIFSPTAGRGQELPITYHPSTDGWQDLFEANLSNAIHEPGSWTMQDGVL